MMQMMSNAKKVLVTGGCGFVGYHLVRLLSEYGYEVRVVDRIPPPVNGLPVPSNVQYYQGYLQYFPDLSDLLDGVDTVFHLAWSYFPEAGNKDVGSDIQLNLMSTVQLLHSCVKSNVRRFVFLSTGGAVYGPVEMSPVNESHPTKPISSYGVTKLAAEKYVCLYHRLHNLEYAILRPSLPYGPGQNPFGRQGVIAIFMGKILQGQPITILGDGKSTIRDFFYVSDLAQACVMAANGENPATILNIGGGEAISLSRLVNEITEIIGPDYPIRVQYAPPRSYDPSRLVLDITSAREVLGWEPQVLLREGLCRTWDWVQTAYGCQHALPVDECCRSAVLETAVT